jgi:D-aminopeptidase
MRTADLGIRIGTLEPGPYDAITDVPGIRVGHATIIQGDGPLVVGKGPVRTGVTVVVPHDGDPWVEPVFAGTHRLNGNGELTGLEWVREAGLLSGIIGITNTHSVGIVHDALIAHAVRSHRAGQPWTLPVVGETYDGALSDMDGFHVRPEHVEAAIATAAGGPVVEGGVGGGTGMICHEFKGGIGTASRRIPEDKGGWTVGVLVQANYGRRSLLRIDGVPVGAAIPTSEVPSPWDKADALDAAARMEATRRTETVRRSGPGGGSIIIIVATDAPLLPHQCTRVAQRPSLALGRMGSIASTGSGDLFLAFATGNRLGPEAMGADDGPGASPEYPVRMVGEGSMNAIFEATVEATEAAIVAALIAAETMTGRDGITAHALPHDRLLEVMAAHGRGPRSSG